MAMWNRIALAALAVSMGSSGWGAMAADVAAAPVTPVAGEAKESVAVEVKPTRVTLELKNASPEEAFDQLGRQAGLELVADDSGMWQMAEPVTLSVKEAPFWPTFLDVCRQSKISFQTYYDQSRPRTLRLMRGENNRFILAAPYAQSEGFVIIAQSANRNYNISYDNPRSGQGGFSLQLMVLCDPAMPLQQVGNVTVSVAVDENGVSLRNPSGGGVMYGSQPGFVQQTGVQLAYPTNAGKKLAVLKGMLRPTVVMKMEEVTVDAPLTLSTPVKKQLADYDVTIGPLKKPANKGGSYELKVSFTNKSGGAGVRRGRSNEYWGLLNSIVLTDAEGRRLSYNGGGGGGGNPVTYTVNFSTQGDETGEPQKLSWQLPAETREVQVPFELKDLVIP